MIVCVGEILADLIGKENESVLTFKCFCGGAPFNVAVNAKKAGAKVGFIGKVGCDSIGRFLISESKKAGFDDLNIQLDDERNTTLAFVTLNEGERDFSFYRHDTADYNIDLTDVNFCKYENLNIVHLGSLMLSESNGVKLAREVVDKSKKVGAKLSFDMNFRMDIYEDFDCAKNTYKPFVDCADIIKFSDDELRDYTGVDDIVQAIQSFYRNDTLVLVTLGAKGSMYYINGEYGVVDTEKVKPIDTTGAGDAFFGTFLACIEGREFTCENIVNALKKANKAGAETTQFLGAVKL